MPAGSVVLTALWTTVFVVMVVQARRRGDPLLWWMGLLGGLLAVAEMLRWPDVAAAGQASGDALRTVALLLVAIGVAGYLLSVFADQRRARRRQGGRQLRRAVNRVRRINPIRGAAPLVAGKG